MFFIRWRIIGGIDRWLVNNVRPYRLWQGRRIHAHQNAAVARSNDYLASLLAGDE